MKKIILPFIVSCFALFALISSCKKDEATPATLDTQVDQHNKDADRSQQESAKVSWRVGVHEDVPRSAMVQRLAASLALAVASESAGGLLDATTAS